MGKRFPFSSLPTGWYNVALSRELRTGQLLTKHYFGQELIVYRTASGQVRVSDAHCPHMGAHLGRIGHVEGEILRCGFHGFQYDTSGQCVGTPYGGPPPPRARLRFWQVREQNGLIMVWFDEEGRAPFWELPLLEADGWNRLRFKRYRIATHPQETTENSVDFGHFTQIHGFTDGSITKPIEVQGELLTSSYRAWRGLPTPKISWLKLPVDYAVTVRGLGYSQVDVRIEPIRLEFRVFVLSTPIDEENVDLVIAGTTHRRLGLLAPLARRIAHKIVCSEVDQDLDVWTHKRYHESPALAKGDGPVAEYRRYVRQFYPKDTATPIAPARRTSDAA